MTLTARSGVGRNPLLTQQWLLVDPRRVGRRYLDEENIAPVGGFTTVAATLGYRWDRYGVSFEGTNLTDRRPPVTASEFGSQSVYLLNGRQAWLKLSYCMGEKGCGAGG